MINNRRELLGAGAALLTLPAGAAFAASPQSDPPAKWARPFRVVFDQRLPDSRQFAQDAKRLGAATAAIDDDVSRLWYTHLRPGLQQEPAAIAGIAGLTGPDNLFCLEHLARGHWMKPRFRAEHRFLGDGRVEHRMVGSDPLVRRANVLLGAGRDWTATMADLVTCYPAGQAKTADMTITTRTRRPWSGDDQMVSWIIAANS